MARYYIPEENIEALEKKLWRIRGKCDRYGIDFKYLKGEKFFEREKDKAECKAFYPVDVEGKIHFNGWSVCGLVKHGSCGNMIYSFSENMPVPEDYRHADCFCEHCGVKRHRNETVILYNEKTSEFKQVGKTCLLEYTGGIDAQMVAMLEQFEHEPDRFTSFGESSKNYLPTHEYLEYVYACYKLFGWKSKAKIQERYENMGQKQFDALPRNEQFSTAEYARSVYTETFASQLDIKAVKEFLRSNDKETREYVENALEFVANHAVDNEFWGNVKVVCHGEYFEAKLCGFTACAIMLYAREMEKRESAKKENEERKNTEFFGVVGTRYKLTGVLNFRAQFDTMYGEMFIYEMVVGNNVFVWKTTTQVPESILGKRVVLTGTVKEHKTYRGINQTYLSRCKVAC